MLSRFDFHIHTNYSDGTAPPTAVIESTLGRNLKAVAVTDHGPEHQDGVSLGRIDQMIEDVEIARKDSDFPILIGMETNIVDLEGSIDIGEEVLDKLDVVLAGVHSLGSSNSIPEAVARDYFTSVMGAIGNQKIDVLTHPFWFFDDLSPHLSSEDLSNFAKAASDRGVAIELNERYHAPSEDVLTICLDEGVKISVGSDAHRLHEVGKIKWAMKMLEQIDVESEDLILYSFL